MEIGFHATEKHKCAHFLLEQLPPSEVKVCERSTANCLVGFTLLIIRKSDFHLKECTSRTGRADSRDPVAWTINPITFITSIIDFDFIAQSAVWSECSPLNHNLCFFWRTIKRCHTQLLQYCFGLCCQLIKRYLKEVFLTKESSQPGSLTDKEEGAW